MKYYNGRKFLLDPVELMWVYQQNTCIEEINLIWENTIEGGRESQRNMQMES